MSADPYGYWSSFDDDTEREFLPSPSDTPDNLLIVVTQSDTPDTLLVGSSGIEFQNAASNQQALNQLDLILSRLGLEHL